MGKKRRNNKTKIDALQAANAYNPCKRLRSQCLDDIDFLKLGAAISNSMIRGWELTLNVKILAYRGVHRISMMRRKRITDKVGKRVVSATFNSAIEAENNVFYFRYSLESQKSKTKLDIWQASLSDNDSEDENIPTLLDNVTNHPDGKQRLIYREKIRSTKLTSNLIIQHFTSVKNMNPNNSKFEDRLLSRKDVEIECAKMIQKCVRRRNIERARQRIRQTQKDQAYRRGLIASFKKKLAAEQPWRELILGANDDEVADSTSDFDREHVVRKTRHIIDALRILIDRTEQGTPVTWKGACIRSCEENYNCVGYQTVMMWYLDLHSTTTGDLRFTKSGRGSSSAAAISPFAEDESLLVQFKAWACSDLEHLTIKKARDWVNEKLLAEFTVENLRALNISYPVKENVVSNWMREAGFRYAAYKKSYYMDRHEAPDIVADREKYLVRNFDDKICE